MGLHVGGFIVWRGVLVAREPASRSVDKTSLSASRNADRLRNGLLRSVGACRLCVDRPRRRPRAPQPGPVGQLGRLSETPVAFARSSVRGVETVVAFVGAKWAFLVHFSAAEVMPVSMVAVWGRAVVPAVSCWPAPVAAEVLLVSTSPRCRASCAKKFALLGLMWVRARKSSPSMLQRAKNRCFLACWASFSRKCRWRGRAGRVFSRKCRRWGCAGVRQRGGIP